MGMEEKYSEIWRLKDWCEKLRIPHRMEDLYDGYALRFLNASQGDFIQHEYSYGSTHGCVEPAIGCRQDYTAVTLKKAKWLVLRHWFKLRRVKRD